MNIILTLLAACGPRPISMDSGTLEGTGEDTAGTVDGGTTEDTEPDEKWDPYDKDDPTNRGGRISLRIFGPRDWASAGGSPSVYTMQHSSAPNDGSGVSCSCRSGGLYSFSGYHGRLHRPEADWFTVAFDLGFDWEAGAEIVVVEPSTTQSFELALQSSKELGSLSLRAGGTCTFHIHAHASHGDFECLDVGAFDAHGEVEDARFRVQGSWHCFDEAEPAG